MRSGELKLTMNRTLTKNNTYKSAADKLREARERCRPGTVADCWECPDFNECWTDGEYLAFIEGDGEAWDGI